MSARVTDPAGIHAPICVDENRQEALVDFAQLQADLRAAQETPDARRAMMVALQGVHSFLNSVPQFAAEGLASPIFALLLALQDLDNGTVAPALEKAPGFPNRHPDPTGKKIMKAFCSFCVDQMVKAGSNVPDACREVAAALLGNNLRKHKPSNIDWKRIKNWRDGASKLHLEDHEARLLSELRLSFPEMSDIPPAARIKRLRAQLTRMDLLLGRYVLD